MGLELEVSLQAVPALGDNLTFDVTLYDDAVFGFATADKPWLIFGATGDDIRYTFTGLVGTADSTGDRFTVALPQVDPGLYDVTISAVRADGTKTLVNIRNDLETTGDVSTADMGTLLEGSALDDPRGPGVEPTSIVSALDASLLAAAYGTSSGDTKFDARVDFNRDGQVDAADLALLKGNYLEFSPRLLNPLSAPTGLNLLPASDSGRSDTDNITNVATPTIALEADLGTTVHLLLDGVETADAVAASRRVEFTVGPLSDGPHVFTATAEGGDGRVSGESEPLVVLIDTGLPSLPLEAPLAGGRYTATARLIGSATDQVSGLDVVQYTVDGGGASPLALNAQGGFDLPLAAVLLAAGPHQLSIDALDIAGNSTQVTADFDVASDFTVGPDGTGGWGSVVGDSAQLEEGDSFLVQVALPVELAGASTRTLSFEVVANFDPTDEAAVTDDRFLVYLVSTADSGQTLLDRGQPGTAIFSLGEGGAEFVPGLVGYDGSVVEIDLSSLSGLTTGDLVFQLLGGDSDTGSVVRVRALTNVVDPEGVPNPVFPLRPTVAQPGPGLDLTGLAPSTHVELLVGNVRLEPTSGLYTADLRVRNRGPDLGRRVVVVFPGLPAGVRWLEPSGTDAGGAPYVSFRNAIAAGRPGQRRPLQPGEGEPGQPRPGSLHPLSPGIGGRPEPAARIGARWALDGHAGGRLEVALMATDPEDDPVSFSLRRDGPLPTGMLEGDGTLVFTPTPAQVGAYNFTVVASDGALEATGDVLLTVEADPVTTTRLSGTVLTTGGDPLIGVSIELGATQTVTSGDGSFELDLTLETGDTLVIHGELIDGADVYPFIAEKVVLLLGHEIFPGTDNVIARPIFLPALDMDNAVTIDPTKDTTVTTKAIPGAAVMVAAGTLESPEGDMYTGDLGITEVPTDLTPAALPDNLIPTTVVTIQPGEMVFTTPAPLSLPNLAGYPPGTEMDLWSINPQTGLFDNVGTGRVTGDGSVIETVSGAYATAAGTSLPHLPQRTQSPMTRIPIH